MASHDRARTLVSPSVRTFLLEADMVMKVASNGNSQHDSRTLLASWNKIANDLVVVVESTISGDKP